jgi:hypothetical protein
MRSGRCPIEVDRGFVVIVGLDFWLGVIVMVIYFKVGMDETCGMVMVRVAGMEVGEGCLQGGDREYRDAQSDLQGAQHSTKSITRGSFSAPQMDLSARLARNGVLGSRRTRPEKRKISGCGLCNYCTDSSHVLRKP